MLFIYNYFSLSLVVQTVKNLPAMQETWIWSLDREDPMEKGMATHFSILAWRIPWSEEPGGLQSKGSQRVKQDWMTNTFTFWLEHNSSQQKTVFQTYLSQIIFALHPLMRLLFAYNKYI